MPAQTVNTARQPTRGLRTKVWINGIELSCYLTEASIERQRQLVEANPWMNSGPSVSLPGQSSAILNLAGYYTSDFLGAHRTLLRTLGQSGEFANVLVFEEGYGANKYCTAIGGVVTQYQEGRTLGEMVKFTATVDSSAGWVAKVVSMFNVNTQALAAGTGSAIGTQRSTITIGPSNGVTEWYNDPAPSYVGYLHLRNYQPASASFALLNADDAALTTNAVVMATATIAQGAFHQDFIGSPIAPQSWPASASKYIGLGAGTTAPPSGTLTVPQPFFFGVVDLNMSNLPRFIT